MNIKLKPRTNGQLEQPKWEQDDAEDKLAEKLASQDIPTLPPMATQDTRDQRHKPKETVNVRELMETLLEAWTNPSVRMWVQDNDLCFEQVDMTERVKNSWVVRFAGIKTTSVKLIK
jgi:hypothetical protein